MSDADVSIRLKEGDTIVRDGASARVQSIDGDEIQFAVPGGTMDIVRTVEEFEHEIADAEHLAIHR